MATPRRFLPSISLLTAFESVMRTGSTLAAAQDLNLTQGAVSRLVQNLESQLDTPLFYREGRRLVPTEKARAYAGDIRKALDLIAHASMRVQAHGGEGSLNLSILPSFGTRWLAPRLPRFCAAHPGITIHLGTRLRPFDFAHEGFDAAIHFGRANWPEAGHALLFTEQLIACAAPGFMASHPIGCAKDLYDLPLLQLETRPNAWTDWFAHHGQQAPHRQGMLFDHFAPMIQATIYGMGIALLPEFLVRTELLQERLVIAHGETVPSEGSYYLVWPAAREHHPPLAAFRDWVLKEINSPPDDPFIAW